MIKNILLSSLFLIVLNTGFGQNDSTKASNPFTISGSVDAYFRNAFDTEKGATNNYTSFTNSNKKLQLGMLSAKVDYTKGNFFATVDLGYGKRAEEFSYNDKGLLANIKQAYLAYTISDKLKLSAGKWATHVGYELLDAPLNRNYSMSYGFSYGPFFHTGLKADFAINSKSGIMLGIANPTDHVNGNSPYKILIGQYSNKFFDDKTVLYLNYQGGKTGATASYTQWDIVLTNALSNTLALNYDGTLFTSKDAGTKNSWKSNALYLNYDLNSTIGFTYRTEFFDDKKAISAGAFATNIFANTLSMNYKIHKLTFIPEMRFESAKDPIYLNKIGDPTKKSVSFILAAIYKF